MKLLLVVPTYPHPGHPFSGVFNQRCAHALRQACERVEVLAPRPYSPPLLGRFKTRWKMYSRIPRLQEDRGILVHRPGFVQLPGIVPTLWADPATYGVCRRVALRLQERHGFDAILSFDLLGAGSLAWRLGRLLHLPAAGWATGSDVRYAPTSPEGRLVTRALRVLDMVFCQSRELLARAAFLLGVPPNRMEETRYVVLPRGVATPGAIPRNEMRRALRSEWGIGDENVVVLAVGRISREKGTFELLEAVRAARRSNPRIVCVLVGAHAGFDDSADVMRSLATDPTLRDAVRVVPACAPDRVWEHLSAADIFAFTSHREGMPNSLLEAMAMEVPAVAFGIPPVLEIEANTGAVQTVPPLDVGALSQALVALAASPSERVRLGRLGRRRVEANYLVAKNMALAVRYLAGISPATMLRGA